MLGKLHPMDPAKLRRFMSDRSIRAYLEQRRNERRAVGSRLGFAIAIVVANRTGSDWAWFDQDRSNHRY
jgi:hypothetical protein